MINPRQLLDHVINPTLSAMNLYSEDAAMLLLFTATMETNCGDYIVQVNGPALGIYQMEPKTHDDIYHNYLRHRAALLSRLMLTQSLPARPNISKLVTDLSYATTLTRLHYLRVSSPLPKWTDRKSLWEYYKQYYNTPMGKAERDDKRWEKVLGKV